MLAESERQFLGVYIPRDIYLRKDLTPTEKLLLVEITNLTATGTRLVSHEHLAEFLGVSKKQIAKLVTKLAEKGLINVELGEDERNKTDLDTHN